MIKFFKYNMRPLLMMLFMSSGIILYAPLGYIDDLTCNTIAPALIFLMLFVTFCKVDIRDLRLQPLHFVLLLFQIVATPCVYYLMLPFGPVVAQGAMVCFLAPIAMAAVAIGAILGANIVSMITYTLLCNVAMAFVAPIYLNLFGNGECDFGQIMVRVAPLLLAPMILSELLKLFWRDAANWVADHSQISFYMWLFSMMITLARTTNYIVATIRETTLSLCLILAFIALVSCLVQYVSGRMLGSLFCSKLTGAQSLGQKNTVLTVWLSQAFLDPVSSIAPTAYIVWQNLVNSLQIYLHDRVDRASRITSDDPKVL